MNLLLKIYGNVLGFIIKPVFTHSKYRFDLKGPMGKPGPKGDRGLTGECKCNSDSIIAITKEQQKELEEFNKSIKEDLS